MTRCVAFSIVCLLMTSHAEAQTKPEDMGTPQQRAACSHDVGRYCKSVKPEEGPFALPDVPAEKPRKAPARLPQGY